MNIFKITDDQVSYEKYFKIITSQINDKNKSHWQLCSQYTNMDLQFYFTTANSHECNEVDNKSGMILNEPFYI